MQTNFKNIVQLLDYFKEEETCKKYLEMQRWGDNVCCIHCGNAKVYRTNRGFKCADKTCAKKFSVTTGTVFENTKIKLRYWFGAVYLATAHKKGVSSHQLSRDLGVTQKTAWFMLHRIRHTFNINNNAKLDNMVEIDETYIGGKESNKNLSKRKKVNGTANKTPVFGMLEREGKVITMVVKETNGNALKPIIRESVKTSATIITDGFGAYKHLDKEYKMHTIIQHDRNEYVNGIYHTNSIEGFWSLLKRGIFGIYHSVSPKHLERYCDEFSYRYNTRSIADTERFNVTLGQTEGRLTYKTLINK